MAEIRGLVMKKHGERAEVKVNRTESELKNLPKYLDCWNPINAKVGDVIGAEYRETSDKTNKAIIYGFPALGILAGVGFGHATAMFFGGEEWMFILGSIIIWLIVTVNYARIYARDAVREGQQPVIYEVQVQELVIDTGK